MFSRKSKLKSNAITCPLPGMNTPNYFTRMRAHAITLSNTKCEIEHITETSETDRKSVRAWIKRFHEGGVDALLDDGKPSGPRKPNNQEEVILRDMLRQCLSQPAAVISRLCLRTRKSIGRVTLRRHTQRFDASWKRFLLSLRKKRGEKAFRLTQDELAELFDEPTLGVVDFDEAGFSPKGAVPCGWLPKGKRPDVPVTGAHGSNVQAIGLEYQDCRTETHLHKGHVNTQTIVEITDDFCGTREQTTVVALDNASCHTSNKFKACLEQWAERGLLIYHLPLEKADAPADAGRGLGSSRRCSIH